jgi:tetratricopeptide (TPR) repeat protein/O-antigen ligase
MQHEHIEKIFVRIIKGCLYLMVFAPLLLSADYFFPAIFPKAIYIRILIEVAIVAYVPLAIVSKKFRPRYHLVYVLLALFGILVLLTSITGENFSYSFWGNYERMDGVFSWLHYWAIILVSASVLRTKKEWLVLFSFSIGAAFLMSGYGFLQRFGVAHFGPLTIYETNLGRITGTIGNPAFLAVYLLFNVTFGLLIIISKSIHIWWRIVVGSALIPIFIAYIMSGVRGAFIGFVAGVCLFFLGNLLWSTSSRLKKLVAQGFFGFIGVLAVLYALVDHNAWVTKHFGRFFTINLADETIQTRFISWRGAITGFRDNFWLGVGPQKFDVVFNQHFNPEFYSLVGNETWWDRAHNMVLEVAATTGIFGLLTYLAVGAALVYSLWCLGNRHTEHRVEVLIFVSFLSAYFIQNLFVFDTISSYIVLSVLVAYIIARTSEATLLGERFKGYVQIAIFQLREFLPTVAARHWWIGLIAFFVIMTPIAYAGNIKLIKHNKLVLTNLAYGQAEPFAKTIENYKEIFDISSFDSREVGIKLSQYIGQRALSGKMTFGELQSGYSFTITALDQVIEQNPKDVRLLLSYGNTLNVYGELLKAQDPDTAMRILKKSEGILSEAARLGIARQQVFHSLANTYLIMGDRERGITTLIETTKLHPDNPITYWLLAFAHIQGGEYELGIQAATRALDNNYKFASEREAQPVATVLAERGDYDQLLRLYRKVAKDVPTGTAHAKVAATLAQIGRKDEAIKAAQEVIRIAPSLKADVEDFIKKVESGEDINFITE